MKGYWAKKQRIWEIDFLRGLAIVLMIIDHLIFDIVYFFREAWINSAQNTEFYENLTYSLQGFVDSRVKLFFHFLFVGIFLIISGISNEFSKNNIIRGIKILLIASMITIITMFLGTPVKFGILHLLGICIIVDGIIRYLLKDVKYLFAVRILFILLLIVLDIATRNVSIKDDKFLFIFSYNLIGPMIESFDYAPIFQYAPLFIIGTMFSPMYKKRESILPALDKKINIVFNFIGEHAIWFYVFHQPVIILVLQIISMLFITNGKIVKI